MNKNSERVAFQQLLTLLRAALWGQTLPYNFTSDQIDWATLLRHAEQQTVSALVGDVLLEYAEALHLPDPVAQWANRHVSQARQGNLRLNLGVRDVIALLQAHGLEAVLLKGQGVALDYPKPRLRQCGDIDLYLGPTQYDEAVRVMCEASGDTDGSENDKHYHLSYRGLQIELHRRALMLPMPWQDRSFRRWTTECLEGGRSVKVRFDDTEVSLPPAAYNAIFLLGHAWHHFLLGGVGLRQVCDWARYLHVHAPELKARELETHLRRYGLWTAWRVWACLAVEELGLPQSECPCYDAAYSPRAQRALNIIMREGNFGHYSASNTARPRGYFAGKWHNCCQSLRRFGSVMRVDTVNTLQTFPIYIIDGVKAIVVNDKMGTKPVTVSRSDIERA